VQVFSFPVIRHTRDLRRRNSVKKATTCWTSTAVISP
jgi:hypothetical protein